MNRRVMKTFARGMRGVTLLEIMLVLAIASMIIVMSVRYYQSASSSQQANTFIEQVQAIAAAADSLSQSTGSFSGVTQSNIAALLPGGTAHGLTTPWGTSLTFSVSTAGYNIGGISMPTAICPIVQPKIQLNNHFAVGSGCGTITYTANP